MINENPFDEMRFALQAARRAQAAVDNNTDTMASMLVNRLRRAEVQPATLRKLKKELAQFNMATGKWKD